MPRPVTEAATYTVITVRLPPAMLAVLREHGATYHMSLNAEILSAIEERVALIQQAQRVREGGKKRRAVLSTV